jgi:hypothetical protein
VLVRSQACVFAATLKISGKEVPRDPAGARQLAQRPATAAS